MRPVIGKILIAIILLPVLFIGFYLSFPNVAALAINDPVETSFMRYREREWLREGHIRHVTHTPVPLSKISPNVIKAVITSEDGKFWSHEGFDFEALEKAARKNIRKKRFASGGSTITQQLAKNLYLTPEKSVLRKAKEAIITWRLERTLSKRRILELYLNAAEWGDGIFGIEAAARHYYHKSASGLTAGEAAHLAAVLPNPRKWNPTGGSRLVERRAGRILGIMNRRGEIEQAYNEIMNEPAAETAPETPPDSTGSTGTGTEAPSPLPPETAPAPEQPETPAAVETPGGTQ